jgi:hypothetical protein
MSVCLFTKVPSNWEKVVIWCVSMLRGKGLQTNISNLCLGACIYHLWQQMNAFVHNNNLSFEEAIVKQITSEVRT